MLKWRVVVSPPSRGARLARALLSLGLLAAFAGLIVLSALRYLQVGEVYVPDVVGQDASAATRTLERLGFDVSTYTEEVQGRPGGVTSQTPDPGTLVRQGRGVSLGVGAAERGSVPNVVGLPQDDAAAQLGAQGLSVTELRYRYAPQAAGTVLGQTPAPGGAAWAPPAEADPAGSGAAQPAEVTLTVSRGPQPQRVAVPNLVGQRAAAARQQLSALGFRRVEVIPSRLGPPGVHTQVPAAGERVPLSTQVTLYTTVSNPQVVRVPPVVGLSAEAAARRLSAAGLRVAPLQETPFDPSRPRGVVAVSPETYTLWGSPVVLTVNGEVGAFNAPEPAPPPRLTGIPGVQEGTPGGSASSPPTGAGAGARPGGASPTGALPAVGGRAIPIEYDPANYGFLRGRAYAFRVEVSDEQGSRVAIDRQMRPDEPVEDTVVVYGEAELRMYIDGQIVLAYNPPNP